MPGSLLFLYATLENREEPGYMYAMTAIVAKSAAYLEGSVAELSLALWTLGPW